MDHPEHQPGQGEQDVAEDDRAGQPATGGTLLGDVVLDEPDGQQVEPDERGHEPADQGGNAHGLSSRRTRGLPGTSPVVRRRAGPSVPVPCVLAYPSPYVTNAGKRWLSPRPACCPPNGVTVPCDGRSR